MKNRKEAIEIEKSVLISIKPKYCELIASGRKTVEVRKTRPRVKTPFKCYIYCTKSNDELVEIIHDGDDLCGDTYHGKTKFLKAPKTYSIGRSGKVVGEFVCDEIVWLNLDSIGLSDGKGVYLSEKGWNTCLLRSEIIKYSGIVRPYGWHISDLKIYDKPKELREFTPFCKFMCDDWSCQTMKVICFHKKADYNPDGTPNLVKCARRIERAPQSWSYIAGLQEEE